MKQIPLTQGQFALVDDEDYERVSRFKWCAYRSKNSKTFYACRGIHLGEGRSTTQQMHRFILNLTGRAKTDHRDGNGLNNQKQNLRKATTAQNGRNRGKQINNKSGYKGVYPSHPDARAWVARVRLKGKPHHFGTYPTEEQAARAYDIGALKLHGEFARLNFTREI